MDILQSKAVCLILYMGNVKSLCKLMGLRQQLINVEIHMIAPFFYFKYSTKQDKPKRPLGRPLRDGLPALIRQANKNERLV